MKETVTHHLAEVKVKARCTYERLTVFPLIAPGAAGPDYRTLDEALAAGTVSVSEVSDAGTVPVIRFSNTGDLPVLILDGEELVGAKQNRIVNLTILAPAKQMLDIPVSCVEAGRWDYASRKFTSAKRAIYSSLRARKAERVTMNLASAGSRAADQSEIWADIARKSHRMKSRSPTDAMAQIYENHEEKIGSFAEKLRPVPGQHGVVFAIRDRIVGFDLFDRASTLDKLYPKLISSYALDALDSDPAPFSIPTVDDAGTLLVDMSENARIETFAAIGEGTDVRITSPRVAGAALVAGGQPVHVCGFRKQSGSGPARERSHEPGSRFARASIRRRYRESRD